MIELIVWLAVLVIIILIAWFLVNQLSLPEPAKQIVTIVIVVAIGVIAIGVLLSLTGVAPMRLRS